MDNLTSNITEHSHHFLVNKTATVVGAFILSLVFLLGVPGNLFIIWSILARTRKRSVTTLLILNLACADGALLFLTIFCVIYLAKQSWVFGNPMCKVVFYLCNVNMYASIFLITLMSLHRLVAVVWPRKVAALASKRIVLRVLAGLWILVMCASIPAVVYRELNTSTLECALNHTHSRHVRFHYTFEATVGFLIPYGLIVTSYVLILKRLRETKFRRKVRSRKLILAIVVVFCVFWLPYHIINIIQVMATYFEDGSPLRRRLDHFCDSSHVVASALAFISSCANPILYTFAGKSYIKQSGMAFMARLFEGTSLDTKSKKGRLTSKKEGLGLNELESPTSNGVSSLRNESCRISPMVEL